MKNLLIISEFRCGSSNLLYAIAKAYGYTAQFEPDSNKIKKKLKIKDNTVVKIIVGENTQNINYYTNLISKFDKIILLSRKDFKKQCEAYWALGNLNNSEWNKKWHVKDLPINIQTLDSWKIVKNFLSKQKELLKQISEQSKIQIQYYEDIYLNKSLEDKSIKLNLDYFDEKYKLRHEHSQTIV